MALAIDNPVTTLTEEDIATVVKVALATQGKKTNSVITVRGPETMEALAKALPERAAAIRKDFARLQRLGTTRRAGTLTDSENGNPSVQYIKHVEKWFEGSPNYPKGIPVGMYEMETQAVAGVSNKWSHTGSRAEIDDEEKNRLYALAYGQKFLTQPEIVADEVRKNDARNARTESDLNPTESTAKTIGAALGPAMAAAFPAMIAEMKKQGFTITAPPEGPKK